MIFPTDLHHARTSVGDNLLASQTLRCVRRAASRTSSLLQIRAVAHVCRRQLVGEPGAAVCQARHLANKFAPTDPSQCTHCCRRQPVGEPGAAVCLAPRLANKFAPTDPSHARTAVGDNLLASQALRCVWHAASRTSSLLQIRANARTAVGDNLLASKALRCVRRAASRTSSLLQIRANARTAVGDNLLASQTLRCVWQTTSRTSSLLQIRAMRALL